PFRERPCEWLDTCQEARTEEQYIGHHRHGSECDCEDAGSMKGRLVDKVFADEAEGKWYAGAGQGREDTCNGQREQHLAEARELRNVACARFVVDNAGGEEERSFI